MPQLQRRARWLVLFVGAVFLVLFGRLWQLQVLHGESYHEGVIKNVVSERFLPSVRGKILDRDGEVLVDNRPAFNIYVTPALFDDQVAGRLAELRACGRQVVFFAGVFDQVVELDPVRHVVGDQLEARADDRPLEQPDR